MSFKLVLILDDKRINVLSYRLSFDQGADSSGRPSQIPIFNGIELVIETQKDVNLADWAFSPNQTKQFELHFEPVVEGSRIRKLKIFDGCLVNWQNNFSSIGNQPMSERLFITAAGVEDSFSNAVYSAKWRKTYPEKEIEPTTLQNNEEKEPKILNGWWTKNKDDSQNLKKAKLGDTVYFHIETKDIDNGEEIDCKLWDLDKFIWDYLNPDDDKFNEKEVHKKAIVQDNKATIELLLNEKWEPNLREDTAYDIELYWEVKYNDISKSLPNRESLYLEVEFSDKTLYFKTPTPSHNLPEFISYEGDPMLLMEYSQGQAIGEAIKFGDKLIDKKISNIAFTKLKKGYMVDNNGKVYTGKRQIYEYKKMYDNSGELFENVKKGKNFGYNHGNGLVTTRGISQYDYFSKNGKRVKALGLLKKVGAIFDVFDIFKFAASNDPTSETLPIQLGPLTPLVGLVSVLVQQQKAEMDMWLEESVQEEIDIAKLQGLEATRKAINSWNHNKEFKWDLLTVSNETANKLLAGEFKTFEELNDFEDEQKDRNTNSNIQVLYRTIEDDIRGELYIIETLFINE